MLIYLLCFVLSCVLLKIADNIKNNLFKKITILIALLLPCILAGLRSSNIGVDIKTYLEPIFECAKTADNYSDFLSMRFYQTWSYAYISSTFERGFVWLVYAITKLTSNIQFVYFAIEVLIIFPVYYGLKKFKKIDGHIWFAMLIFYLLFYNQTLNLMRQFIAISITFYGLSSVINNDKHKIIKFFAALIVGFLFHKSSLLILFVALIYFVLNHNSKSKRIIKYNSFVIDVDKIISILIIIISFILVFRNSILLEMLDLIGMDRYAVYVSGDIKFSINKIIKIIPIIIIFLFNYKKFKLKNEDMWFYIINFIMDSIIISQFSTVFAYSGRIGFYFQIFNIISFTLLAYSSDKKNNRNLTKSAVIIYALSYWIFTYVITDSATTIPYEFFR